jgi:hypothetical protein
MRMLLGLLIFSMQMTTQLSSSSVLSSSQATVTAPVIGDEYVLVKKDKEKKEKETKLTKVVQLLRNTNALSSINRVGGRFGACKARLTYDFSITPTTSGTFQTVVALAPYSDSSFTSYWAHLFSTMRMLSAEVQFDFTEFINSVGHDVALSPVVIGFVPYASASTQYYADVSDYKTSRFAAYSTARPVVRYKVPPAWLRAGWTLGAEASATNTFIGKWATTNYSASPLTCGFVHIASQKAMFDVERNIVGRLILNMEFKGQL